jgi:hypothetical protein
VSRTISIRSLIFCAVGCAIGAIGWRALVGGSPLQMAFTLGNVFGLFGLVLGAWLCSERRG